MPGKVNPVIAESLLMACAQVIGYDATITWCCAAGNFELNVMMPVMAYDLLESIELLAAVSRNFDRARHPGSGSRRRARIGIRGAIARHVYRARARDRLRESRRHRQGGLPQRPDRREVAREK